MRWCASGEISRRMPLRRDFTINALSVRADGEIRDYTGGLADNRRRASTLHSARPAGVSVRIICVSCDSSAFFAEYAQGPIDADGLHAAIHERAGL